MPEKLSHPATVRIFRGRPFDEVLLAQARECLAQARTALALPVPSTFLGEGLHARPGSRTDEE
jgi:hypothetical protein